jgi:hypothetical protein
LNIGHHAKKVSREHTRTKLMRLSCIALLRPWLREAKLPLYNLHQSFGLDTTQITTAQIGNPESFWAGEWLLKGNKHPFPENETPKNTQFIFTRHIAISIKIKIFGGFRLG